MVRLTDRPDMTLDVYRGRKTTIQQQYNNKTMEGVHIILLVLTSLGKYAFRLSDLSRFINI